MRFDKNLPLKARIRKRRRLKRIRFLTIVIMTIVMVCYISYAFGRDKGNDFIAAAVHQETTNSDESKIQQSALLQNNTSETENTPVIQQTSTSEPTPTEMNTPLPTSTKADIKNTNTSSNYIELKNDLNNYIKGFKGQYGIYYRNLVDGDEFGINDTDEYIAASTIKVPLNLYLYTKIKAGSVNPKGIMTYLKSDYEGGTGRLQYNKVGSKYTVKELSRLSIVDSDNVATNMLFRLVGLRNVKNYMRQVGGEMVSNNQNISSPRDMGLYMSLVNDFCNQNSKEGKELMNSLLNTNFSDRLPKLLPRDVEVAHKIGNQVKAIHDVGIVYADKPYILAVMSKDVNENEAYNVIANISKKVYDFVENRE